MSNEIKGIQVKLPASSNDTAQTKNAKNTNSNSQTASPPSSDSITLTKQAEGMGKLEADIKAQSGIDDARVEDLKLAIDTGQFNINPTRVAEKFIEFETQLVA